MLAQAGLPGYLTPAEITRQHPINGGVKGAEMKDYKSQYMHPKWQKRRLEMLESAEYKCQSCEDTEKTLHVHHKRYIKGRDVWDYADSDLNVLCETCHQLEHSTRDNLNEILARLESYQTSDLTCLLVGFLNYIGIAGEKETKDYMTMNESAVNAGYIAGSLVYDRDISDSQSLVDSIKANSPDYRLFVECIPPGEGIEFISEMLKAQGY